MEGNVSCSGTSKEKTEKRITERQARYLDAYRATGSSAKAAKLLGVTQDSASEALKKVARAHGKKTIRELLDREVFQNKTCATASELLLLIKTQEYRCALTGEVLTPDTAELDHKKPKVKGGQDTVDNLQWVERHVNRMKGKMTNEDFIAVCRRVVQWSS